MTAKQFNDFFAEYDKFLNIVQAPPKILTNEEMDFLFSEMRKAGESTLDESENV